MLQKKSRLFLAAGSHKKHVTLFDVDVSSPTGSSTTALTAAFFSLFLVVVSVVISCESASTSVLDVSSTLVKPTIKMIVKIKNK
ncbi:hypothetical protein [Paenibacillus sp. P13VS]|uniref:hypothetical protein n=1 Tax=Paenibacillus sp. P13VS TaxID=2697367 RepID=UPI00187B395E|nr:hypothetical protein [Paenibacillus sp. P13VS]MBE7680123.1 hypothetical protein [Paenibacillus sp. P13VS]